MNMQISTGLQDKVLDEIIQEKIPVTLFLVNGFQFKCLVLAHDDSVIAIEAENRHQIVYKHAISTVSPLRKLGALNR